MKFAALIMTGDPAVDDAPDRCSQTLDGDSGTSSNCRPASRYDPDGATSLGSHRPWRFHRHWRRHSFDYQR